MDWVVKLTKQGGQCRITLPRELLVKAGFEDVEYVRLRPMQVFAIKIEAYHGKGKENRDIQEDQT